jgi:hypothetical protein
MTRHETAAKLSPEHHAKDFAQISARMTPRRATVAEGTGAARGINAWLESPRGKG